MSFRQWRAFVGPRYNHYNWIGVTVGASVDNRGYAWDATTRPLVTEVVDHTITTLQVDTDVVYANAGGVWVYGTYGKAGEYVRYTGKSFNLLTGATREEPTANNHNGYHELDELVSQWLLLDDDDGTLRYTISYDSTLTATTWEGTIQGFKGRHWAIRNNHLIVIQERASPGGAWLNLLLGVIDAPNWRDDANREARWSVKFRSLDSVYRGQKVKGVRVGQLDIAKQSSASSTTPLVLASDERDSNDFLIAEADFDAEKAIDGDNGTLWIAERFMGTAMDYSYPNSDGRNNDGLKFSQLYINPPPDAPPRSRWIELILMTGSASGYTLYSATGTPLDAAWGPLGLDSMGPGDLAILCEDRTVFERMNPLASPKVILENAGFFGHIDPTGGAMRLRLGALNLWRSWIEWGHGNGGIQHGDAPSGSYGTRITAPQPGQNMRYNHGWSGTSNSWDFWQVGKIRHAGYKISTSPDEWIMVTLPGLGLKSRDQISASAPGNGGKLYIVDAAGNPSTSGMPGSGTIQIGSERITYAAKDHESITLAGSGARGASSTTAAGHAANDPVWLVEGGIVTDAHMIQKLNWRRFGGTIYPHKFGVYLSALLNPRSPTEAGNSADYTQVQGLDTNTDSAWEWTFSPPVRAKAIVIRVERMTTDPARPRISEIEAILDPTYYLSSLWQVDGSSVYSVLNNLFDQAGAPAGMLVDGGNTPTISNTETGDDSFWTVATDLAEFTGCKLTVGKNSMVTLSPDTFWSGSPSYTHTWDETNIRDIQKADRNDLAVSQVKLPWRNAAGTDSGTAVYPATAGAIGAVLELDEQIYSNSFAAHTAAVKKWYLAHFPFTVVIESAISYPSMAPGEIHRVRWAWNLTDGVQERLYIVTGVDHWIEKAFAYTTVYLQQIERLVGY